MWEIVGSNFLSFCNNLVRNQRTRHAFLLYCRLVSTDKSLLMEPPVNNSYMRTHTCGELNSSNIGQHVLLCGWLEFQRLDRFALLRDGYGSTQIIVPENRNEIMKKLRNTPLESVVSVSGVVEKRPDSQIKQSMSTGNIEVLVSDFNVINAVQKKLPFSIRNYNKASESLRMKYRYLDLRYPVMQTNLRKRSKLLMKIRKYLIDDENFVEVETPTLFKKTPGGAREYIVPSKCAGEFYSLVQSPQQLKQLLMVGGIDKYFQIARCYRDEGARPDRQPEFTQLDLEMSFCTKETVMDIVEKMLFYSWPKELKIPFPRMSYCDAMKLYGTDQPDLSFNCTIFGISETENKTNSSVIKGVKIPQAAEYFNDELKKELFKILKGCSVDIDIVKLKKKEIESNNKILLNLGIDPVKFIRKYCIESGDIIFIAQGEETKVLQALGKCRIWYLRRLRSEGISGTWESHDKGKFLWITDFPLFESDEDGGLKSVHHPFTSPHPADISLLQTNPILVRGLHYDLVLDGYEVGGGSVRIHNSDLQKNILSMLKIPHNFLEHLIEALQTGAPPHAGIALGIDRLVSIMVGAQTIREVIAFPKTTDGRDPMSGAPTAISEDDLRYYHISITEPQSLNCKS